MKRILIIDGQGGGLGRMLVESLRQSGGYHITAVGTNSIATSNMLRAEPDEAATGENAVRVCSRGADVICGPIGIVIADALTAHKRCDNRVAGIRDVPLAELVRDAVRQIDAVCAETEDAPGGNV